MVSRLLLHCHVVVLTALTLLTISCGGEPQASRITGDSGGLGPDEVADPRSSVLDPLALEGLAWREAIEAEGLPRFDNAAPADLSLPTRHDARGRLGDVTELLDSNFMKSLRDFRCQNDAARTSPPYFPGIQAVDDGTLAGWFGGDQPSDDLYAKFAGKSLDDATSATRNWRFLSYYNRGSVHDSGNPVVYSGKTFTTNSVWAFYRANRTTRRYATRTSSTGRVVKWGDQVETRMLGIWATATDEAFRSHTPKVVTNESQRDAADFEDFIAQIANDPVWQAYVVQSAFDVATAFKCGVPVYTHSGGGAFVGFILRLLSLTRGLDFHPVHGVRDFVVIGLEAPLPREIDTLVTPKPVFRDRLVFVNYLVAAKGEPPFHGSRTWHDVIRREMVEIGLTPVATAEVSGADPDGWNGDGAGHAGLGFYVLQHGRLPGVTFPVAR